MANIVPLPFKNKKEMEAYTFLRGYIHSASARDSKLLADTLSTALTRLALHDNPYAVTMVNSVLLLVRAIEEGSE